MKLTSKRLREIVDTEFGKYGITIKPTVPDGVGYSGEDLEVVVAASWNRVTRQIAREETAPVRKFAPDKRKGPLREASGG